MTDTDRTNFLTDIIDADLESGRHQHVVTRFPPEPNGYPHIGHAKSIWLNYGLAQRYDGTFNLRFDDTNPVAEKEEFVQAMIRDVSWLLGVDTIENVYWASDYFEQLYGFAVELVKKGLAYVDSQSVEELRENRGDFNTPGTPSVYRGRSVDENLDLLERMRAGEFPDGAHVLRAKIDLAHPNMVMRDPLLYRIKHATHHNTGDAWCIYPMYDFAHCLEDAIEGITHSICTLEFENNRELYDWVIDNVSAPSRPRQYEFARLALESTMTSKRKLRALVEEGFVDGWDDPRMPTLSGLRRGGIPAAAIRRFCDLVGVAKTNSTVDLGKFEFVVRDALNTSAPRAFGVLDPLELVIDAPDGFDRDVDAPLWPDDDGAETRTIRLSRRLLIERGDFAEAPEAGWKRLAPGAVVRLRYGVAVRCERVEHGPDGAVARVHCSVASDDDARGAGTIHWLDAASAVPATVRVYDRLFRVAAPGASDEVDFRDELNPDSLVVYPDARVEPWVAQRANATHASRQDSLDPQLRVQFERMGYFAPDITSRADALVFNRIISLKDSWGKSDDVVDHEALRAQKEQERAAQSERSAATRRTPAQVAAERGPDVLARYERLVGAGVSEGDALIIASAPEAHVAFVEAAPSFAAHAATTASLFVQLCAPEWREDAALPYGPDALGALASARATGAATGAQAKALHAHMLQTGAFDLSIIAAVDEDAVAAIVDEVIAAHPDEVARYRGGKTQLLGFLLGQVMRRAGKGANPKDVSAALRGKLDA